MKKNILVGIIAGILVSAPLAVNAADPKPVYVGQIIPAQNTTNTIYRVFFVKQSNTGDVYRFFAGPFWTKAKAEAAATAIRNQEDTPGTPQINDSSVRVIANTVQ